MVSWALGFVCCLEINLEREFFLSLFVSFQAMYLALLTALPGVAGECVPAEHMFAWLVASHAFPYPILSTSTSFKCLANSWLWGSCQLSSPANVICGHQAVSLHGATCWLVPMWSWSCAILGKCCIGQLSLSSRNMLLELCRACDNPKLCVTLKLEVFEWCL